MTTTTDTLPEITRTTAALVAEGVAPASAPIGAAPTLWRMVLGSRRVVIGGGILLIVVLLCACTLPWTTAVATSGSEAGIRRYLVQDEEMVRHPPHVFRWIEAEHRWRLDVVGWFGFDALGRSVLVRCLIGGTISLAVGAAAATISVVLGVAVGLLAGYRGGWTDALLMRSVDIMYGLPYILLVILFKIAFEQPLTEGWKMMTLFWLAAIVVGLVGWLSVASIASERKVRIALRAAFGSAVFLGIVGLAWKLGTSGRLHFALSSEAANLVVLFSAIGLVSWLTMSRVVRGQVLSLRGQPFVEACRAMGLKERRIFARHILPNLIGPITVYATLTVPSAILQESFLSFLGVGVNPPLATWGSLASEGVEQLSPLKFYWWQLVFPCALLAITLLSLNFLGDGLRDVFDPKKEAAKI
jgi:ABC-type dipeptide/oligopeptide/nickel transport system permease subunit